MSDQFIGEIRQVGFNFAPQGWALCNGQLMPIAQNTALFSLLGTNFGGNGTTTFGLPNLQGLVALGMGQGPGLSPYSIGNTVGAASITLNVPQLGPHNHPALAESGRAGATLGTPVGNAWGKSGVGDTPYSTAAHNVTMSQNSTASAGGGAPHNNLMPYLTVNFVIALVGIFPARS
jgi:microcystin-dependent protein